MSIIITSGEYASNHSFWFDCVYLGEGVTPANHDIHRSENGQHVGAWFIYKGWKYSHALLNYDDEGGSDKIVYFKEKI